jgi:hypothetical protein
MAAPVSRSAGRSADSNGPPMACTEPSVRGGQKQTHTRLNFARQMRVI